MFKSVVILYCFVFMHAESYKVITISWARHYHFYRYDYTYFEEFDAFYKVHWDNSGVSWNSAFMACDNEGAQLFYPKEKGEWAVVKNLTALLTSAPNTTDVIVGIHDEIGLGDYVTVDGLSTPMPITDEQMIPEGQDCVLMDLETGIYKTDTCVQDPNVRKLYVCKKIDENPCPTIDLNYQYSKETKKCYKVNTKKRTWKEAWHTCFMEGGMLVSPENYPEANVILQYTKEQEYYFAGFRRISPGSDFYTVKGQKLDDGAYQRWYNSRRNDETLYDCGVIYKMSNELYTKTSDCYDNLTFVCEMRNARTLVHQIKPTIEELYPILDPKIRYLQ